MDLVRGRRSCARPVLHRRALRREDPRPASAQAASPPRHRRPPARPAVESPWARALPCTRPRQRRRNPPRVSSLRRFAPSARPATWQSVGWLPVALRLGLARSTFSGRETLMADRENNPGVDPLVDAHPMGVGAAAATAGVAGAAL